MSALPAPATTVGVLLLDADADLLDRVVGALATADGLGEVRAVERTTGGADLVPACRRLAEVCDVVVGLPASPWPGFTARHDAARELLGDVPYWAIESWHGLPALATVLGELVLAAVTGASDRVLLTAPDAAVVALPAEQRAFLREVAEGLAGALGTQVARPTVAVDHSPPQDAVTPLAAATVATLAEAHGASRVVRCSLTPADGADAAVGAAAAEAGIDLVDVALAPAQQVELLLAAVTTLVAQALGPDA